jgi:hypothetical protein
MSARHSVASPAPKLDVASVANSRAGCLEASDELSCGSSRPLMSGLNALRQQRAQALEGPR